MLMLFPKGDPREAFQIATDAEQEKALRAQGYKALDESGLHPDQFRADADISGSIRIGDVLQSPDGQKVVVSAELMIDEPVKRGPGRPKKQG